MLLLACDTGVTIMINTFLTEEDQALKQQFEQFAKDKLAQLASKSIDGEANSGALLKLLGEAGYLALNVPVEYGGKASSFLCLVLLAETLAHYQAGIAVHLAYHAALIELLKSYGSKQQKDVYLPKLASGELIGTIAYLEKSKIEKGTKVVPEAGKLFLKGSKELVLLTQPEASNAQSPNYTPNLVAVLADDNLVLLNNLAMPTIKIDAQNIALEPKSIYLSNLSFEQHSLNQDDFLTNTKENTAGAISFARNIIKTIIAAAALGMTEGALNQTTNYVQEDTEADKPLSQSQSVLWKLADACTDTSAVRLLTYRAAWSKDENQEAFSRYASMAKSYAAQKANQHIGEGLQILLPFLQTPYFDLTGFYVDSKILQTFDATNEAEKVLLSELLGI